MLKLTECVIEYSDGRPQLKERGVVFIDEYAVNIVRANRNHGKATGTQIVVDGGDVVYVREPSPEVAAMVERAIRPSQEAEEPS